MDERWCSECKCDIPAVLRFSSSCGSATRVTERSLGRKVLSPVGCLARTRVYFFRDLRLRRPFFRPSNQKVFCEIPAGAIHKSECATRNIAGAIRVPEAPRGHYPQITGGAIHIAAMVRAPCAGPRHNPPGTPQRIGLPWGRLAAGGATPVDAWANARHPSGPKPLFLTSASCAPAAPSPRTGYPLRPAHSRETATPAKWQPRENREGGGYMCTPYLLRSSLTTSPQRCGA